MQQMDVVTGKCFEGILPPSPRQYLKLNFGRHFSHQIATSIPNPPLPARAVRLTEHSLHFRPPDSALFGLRFLCRLECSCQCGGVSCCASSHVSINRRCLQGAPLYSSVPLPSKTCMFSRLQRQPPCWGPLWKECFELRSPLGRRGELEFSWFFCSQIV